MNVETASNKEIADLLNVDEELVTKIKLEGSYMTSGVASVLIGVVPESLRNWHHRGILVPDRVLSSGHRRYSLQQVVDYVEKERGISEE